MSITFSVTSLLALEISPKPAKVGGHPAEWGLPEASSNWQVSLELIDEFID